MCEPRFQPKFANTESKILVFFLFATGFETRVQHGLNQGLKPRSNPGYNRVLSDLLRTKDAVFCNEVATVVRNQVVNKVADEGFKPEWNELLHILERRSQRYIEDFAKFTFRDFRNVDFGQNSTFSCKNSLRIFPNSARNPQNFPKSGKTCHFRESGKQGKFLYDAQRPKMQMRKTERD